MALAIYGRVLYGCDLAQFGFSIRQEVYAKLLRLPAQYYLDNSSGHITAKIMYNVEQLTAASSESLKPLFEMA